MQFRNLMFLAIAVSTVGCSNKQNECHQIDDCLDKAYVHKYGVRVRPDYWEEKGQNGQVISFMRDGVTVTQCYNAGELHGECTYTYPNSRRVCKSEIYDCNTLKKENQFYHSGVPHQSTEWTGPECYTVTCWYECGTPRCVEKFEDGRLLFGEYYTKGHHKDSWIYNGEGERMTRDQHGNFICKDDFIGGELAMRTYYYPGGGPREITCFMDGVIHGERKTFYPGGDPCSIESWENGHQNGTSVIFQNGERYAEIPYLDGRKNGIERRYADGSNLSQEITWFENQMHGPTCTYLGDSVQTDWFYKGRLTTRTNFESYYPCR